MKTWEWWWRRYVRWHWIGLVEWVKYRRPAEVDTSQPTL